MVVMEMEKKSAIEEIIGPIEDIVETHMSLIYLGKDEVAKEIKPIDLGFTDLRGIDARITTAQNTASIDQAYCPDLNTHVLSINDDDGSEMPIIVMRRFDSEQELSNLYDRDEVTEDHAYQIGQILGTAHKRSITSDEISDIGHSAITENFDEAFGITNDFIGTTITKDVFDSIKASYTNFIEQNEAYLLERKENGFIKQCHGDAHAGNMFVEDGTVKVFDGIGFKDKFSYMDVISDLAFAYMDAVKHGKTDLAETMKHSYIETTGDKEGVDRLLNFYVSYRAFIRGEISTIIASGIEDAGAKNAMLKDASAYFDISDAYAFEV